MSHPRKVARFREWAKNMVEQATVGDHESSKKSVKGGKKPRRPRRKRIRRMRRSAE
jgi:hypothetical protein